MERFLSTTFWLRRSRAMPFVAFVASLPRCVRGLVDPPGRYPNPSLERFTRPLRRLVRVTGIARVRDLVLICHFGRDELKRMAADIDVGDRLLDLRHVAGHTVAAGTAGTMVRVGFDGGCMRAVWR